MTPEVIESRLLLRAMTLRGIGSYLYGARLEIRPLTILCGTNGSGKSTWFRMLNLLRRSLEEGRLPFSLVDEVEGARQRASWNPYQDAYDVRCPGYTNALFLRGSGGDLAGPTDAEELPLYGPEGTIGLEMLSARDLDLEDRDAPRKSRRNDLWTFLSEGYAARGSSFRVRLTVPDNDPSFIEGIRWFESGAELLFGKDELVRLRQEEEGGPHRLRVSEPLLASLQRTSLMPEAWTQSNLTEDGITLVHVADVSVHEQGREVYVRRVLSELGELGLDLCRLFVVRLRQLLTILFSGTFYVGPIRELQQKLFLSPEEFHDDEPVAKRKVGATGAATHTLIRYFADTPMHRASPPYSGLVTPESQSFGRYDFSADYVDAFLKRARRPQPSLERRIWELGSRALGMLATPPAPPEADDGTWMAGLFNAVLDSPDLLGDFDPPAGVRPEFHSLLDRTRGNV
ncbi:MAG TPA: hypothetical protein VHF22_05125, partial [Planctomycetota bacterium]|nr:hypothetical protein [Planctomycetota bacterium]